MSIKSLLTTCGTSSATNINIAKGYESYPDFTQYLPYADYDELEEMFFLKDGKTIGFIYDLGSISCQNYLPDELQNLSASFGNIFKDIVLDKELTIQIYTMFGDNFDEWLDSIGYDTPLGEHYQTTMRNHFDWITQEKGKFQSRFDENEHFRIKNKKTKMVVYYSADSIDGVKSSIKKLKKARRIIEGHLSGLGICFKRNAEIDLLEWLMMWFNPSDKAKAKIKQALKLRKEQTSRPLLYDFNKALFYSAPESDTKQGIWKFDEKYSALIEIDGIVSKPNPGHIALDKNQKGQTATLLDCLPRNSILVQTIIVLPQVEVKNELQEIEKSAIGKSAEAETSRISYKKVVQAMSQGMVAYPFKTGIYIFGDDVEKLENLQSDLITKITNYGMKNKPSNGVKQPLRSYINHLPFAYSYKKDVKANKINYFTDLSNISDLLPMFSRFNGGKDENLVFFNRGGERLSFDPLSRLDKAFNSHMLWLGATGSGKSSAALYALYCTIAKHNPRVLIIDVGNSFKFFVDFLAAKGLSVKELEITSSNPPPMNPFCDALSLYDEIKNGKEHVLTSKENKEDRDVLNEMREIAQLMITSGKEKEEEKFSTQDGQILLEALKGAILKCGSIDKEVLPEDVIQSLVKMSESVLDNPIKKSRIIEMADCMSTMTTDLFLNKLFNTPSGAWVDVDVVRLEIGALKNDKKHLEMGIVLASAIRRFSAIAEKNQYGDRQNIALFDEFHAVVKHEATAKTILDCTKTTRKYALWLWLLTQNVSDCKGEISNLLSNMEYWMCFGTSPAEIKDISEYKDINEEEIKMMKSLQKKDNKFNEGAVLANKVTGVFRSIPPQFIFNVAGTEKHEKSMRRKVMEECGVSEVEACDILANREMGLV